MSDEQSQSDEASIAAILPTIQPADMTDVETTAWDAFAAAFVQGRSARSRDRRAIIEGAIAVADEIVLARRERTLDSDNEDTTPVTAADLKSLTFAECHVNMRVRARPGLTEGEEWATLIFYNDVMCGFAGRIIKCDAADKTVLVTDETACWWFAPHWLTRDYPGAGAAPANDVEEIAPRPAESEPKPLALEECHVGMHVRARPRLSWENAEEGPDDPPFTDSLSDFSGRITGFASPPWGGAPHERTWVTVTNQDRGAWYFAPRWLVRDDQAEFAEVAEVTARPEAGKRYLVEVLVLDDVPDVDGEIKTKVARHQKVLFIKPDALLPTEDER